MIKNTENQHTKKPFKFSKKKTKRRHKFLVLANRYFARKNR